MFSVLQCSCDLYLMKSCCYFSSRIKFLHWHKLEVSESRSLFTLLAKMVLMEAPPFRTSMHVTHSSEQHQCQNVSLEEIKLGQVDVTYLRVHRGSLSHFSECDLNLAVSVQNLKWVSLSHYLWLWRETTCFVHLPRRRETWKEGEWRTAGEVQMWRKKQPQWLWSEDILTPMGAQLSAKVLRKRSKTYPCPWGVFSLVETDIMLFRFPYITRNLLNSLFCHTQHFPAEDANFQGKYVLILFCWSCKASYLII